MATSSIFHNVVIKDPKKADAFVQAIEASIADPYPYESNPNANVIADKDDVRRLLELRHKKAGQLN